MFNNKFKFDAAADIAKSILEADTKAKMEALKGDQEKLDKNRNGKLDAQDFKILRGEKKVNEAEADYQSSYRVGKTANFKPKASDVGQGRKITGKMGKYGKQPDDDNMVEPPPEHKVGDVKTDPSAVVPGHSTIAAKLHLQTLPKDAEGNPIVKGARKVNAADLVAKRKAMMAADEKAKKDQKNEEYEQLDEIGDTPAGKAALKSYVDKAEKQVDTHWDKVRDQSHLPSDKKMVNRARSARKADQRILGFHKYGGANKGYGAGTGPKNEEYEQLDEIGDTPRGKAALQSYVDKAEKQVDTHWDKVRNQSHLPSDKKMVNRARSTRKADQRILGFHKYGGANKGYGAGPGSKNEGYVEELDESSGYTLKHIKTTKHKTTDDEDNPIDASKKHYEIHHSGSKVGDLVHYNDDYAGNFYSGSLHGRKLPHERNNTMGKDDAHSYMKGVLSSKWHTNSKHAVKESLDERTLTAGETAEKERIIHGMKKSLKGFKARYGDRAKEVMYATATKQAKKD